ncbi:MAG: hypothetical protein LQ349_009126 [Xanthoria aureola]|nr:MAG: hypothetical protein LQ349_009276 [Xanthoria aureola]KAI4215938.1 MAG: hypothetical protein LQ349_009126 [Xanthoria aureola]
MGDLQLSALTSYIEASRPVGVLPQDSHHHALAAQVLHNLQYQHDWTDLRIHTISSHSARPLPKPLVSGLPPHRIYVHPDEQIEMLKQSVQEKDVPSEREWVLPTHLRETWSLRKFAELFDGIDPVPRVENQASEERPPFPAAKGGIGSRRGGKRLLLATVGDDSTVVYYVVHDGIVKPRQN